MYPKSVRQPIELDRSGSCSRFKVKINMRLNIFAVDVGNHSKLKLSFHFSYGSQLVKVKDYYENADVGNFATSQALTEYWIGEKIDNF